MHCPKCNHQQSIWEIGATRNCPKCGVAVIVHGWVKLALANAAMCFVFGGLFAAFAMHGGAIGWVFAIGILAAWWLVEVAAMRGLLKIRSSANGE